MRCTYARFAGAPAAAACASAVSSSCTGIGESCRCPGARASLPARIVINTRRRALACARGFTHDTGAPTRWPALTWMPPALDLLNLPDADVVALAQQGDRKS